MSSLSFGPWLFRPSLLPTVAVLLVLPLLLSLGFWQLHRAEFKQQLLDQFATRTQQSPQPLTRHPPNFTPMQVTGYYDNQHSILFDNRIVNHQAGYDILTPFIPQNDGQVLLVNRGWVPRQTEINQGTLIPVNGQQTIVGITQVPEHNMVLSHSSIPVAWPLIIEDIRFKELEHELNRPLYPFILLLSTEMPHGFIRHWQTINTMSPQRHIGYAVQWFSLALTLMIIYLKFNIRRRP